jgi:hypothetical protein
MVSCSRSAWRGWRFGNRVRARFIDAVTRILTYEPCALLAIGKDNPDAIDGRVDALLTWSRLIVFVAHSGSLDGLSAGEIGWIKP